MQIEYLDKLTVHKKRKRFADDQPWALDTLPGEWRDLLLRWVKRGGNSRWDTLLGDAGVSGKLAAGQLLEWLVKHGHAVVFEARKHNAWWPYRLEWCAFAHLRAALGLPDQDDLMRRKAGLLKQLEVSGFMPEPVMAALESLPAQRALDRGGLVQALLQWREQQRSGTRRDFALFARQDTKDVTEAEWRWLEENLDLAAFGVERHTPMLLLAAPLVLAFEHGLMDMGACPDFAALTPATLDAVCSARGGVTSWLVVENRTSFERQCRDKAADAGVIWLPGYPPGWWRQAVARLLEFAPAPARIACDPDPAGIAIAMAAAGLWQQSRLDFEPWKMSPDDLMALPKRKPLTERDREHLRQLSADHLPHMLRALAEAMLQCGGKGEQEGYL